MGPDLRYEVLGHEVLFGDDAVADRCDVCGATVDEDAGEGHAIPGHGLYVWTRGEGEQTRREEPPLCPGCAAALALSALGRWEIEEEEG
jgi:hypothetical protein